VDGSSRQRKSGAKFVQNYFDLRGLKDVKYATLCVPCEHDFMSEICVYLPRYVSIKRNSAAMNGIARLEDEVNLFEYLRLVNTDQF
jgi:hypothetical protein